MPATMAQHQRARNKRAQKLEEDQRLICEATGLIASREQHKTFHQTPVYKIVWHLAWWDGNAACGKTWNEIGDLVRRPRKFLVENVCLGCARKVGLDDKRTNAENIVWLQGLMTRCTEIMARR